MAAVNVGTAAAYPPRGRVRGWEWGRELGWGLEWGLRWEWDWGERGGVEAEVDVGDL